MHSVVKGWNQASSCANHHSGNRAVQPCAITHTKDRNLAHLEGVRNCQYYQYHSVGSEAATRQTGSCYGYNPCGHAHDEPLPEARKSPSILTRPYADGIELFVVA